MAAIMTAGSTGDTAEAVLTGASRVIISGQFANGARVIVQLEADLLNPQTLVEVLRPETLRIEAAASDKLTFTVKGGMPANNAIDISVTAL